MVRKCRFIAILGASIVPAFAAQGMLVPDSAVEDGLRDYLSKCDKANAVVKAELAPTYGYSDEDILGYQHKFFRDCYYYWEGTYGQLIRETVSILSPPGFKRRSPPVRLTQGRGGTMSDENMLLCYAPRRRASRRLLKPRRYSMDKELNVSTSSVLDLFHGKRKISVEMALRLSKYFGNSSKFWLKLQNELYLREARMKMAAELDKIPAHVRSA
jgi:addiction module HigA family antidote